MWNHKKQALPLRKTLFAGFADDIAACIVCAGETLAELLAVHEYVGEHARAVVAGVLDADFHLLVRRRGLDRPRAESPAHALRAVFVVLPVCPVAVRLLKARDQARLEVLAAAGNRGGVHPRADDVYIALRVLDFDRLNVGVGARVAVALDIKKKSAVAPFKLHSITQCVTQINHLFRTFELQFTNDIGRIIK